MEFYFVITEEMLAKYLMPIMTDDSKTYFWKLKYNTQCFYVQKTAGDALNTIKQYGKKGLKYAICKSSLINNDDLLNCINSAITGGELGIEHIEVRIMELTWIEN